MAVFDLQKFLQERLQAFDENMDVSSGSPADNQIIQPVLRRLGTDPFTVDLATFLNDRLKQAFPEMATDEGDGLTDLLIKPSVLLFDPFTREVFRIRNSLSFKDPTTLTTDEADALGANLFSTRELGDFARGTGRVYFAQPRNVSVTPANFFTSKGGLHFFPDGKQDITADEMLLNLDGSLYYFDVNAIAEQAGTAYNIGPNELITIANLEGTAKVANIRRFRTGNDAETAVEFTDRAQQELTERSMVTLRGIGARLPRAFPDVTRLAVVGFGDPEMQRDVLMGGGLGEVRVGGYGLLGQTLLDGENQPATRRFGVLDSGVDFTSVVGSTDPGSFVLTVFFAFSGPPFVRDLPIKSVVSPTVLELEDQVLAPSYQQRPWMIRKKELTLSGIPGGILFPDSANGTVTIPDGEVHVGGLFDVSVRGSDFDNGTLVLDNITDASPAASGVGLVHTGGSTVTLTDLVLGLTYAVGDPIYLALLDAKQFGFTLQILNGPTAGDYRVIDASQVSGSSPILTLSPGLSGPPITTFRWRLVDVIDIDLVDPKETRLSGSDLETVQNIDVVTTAGATDWLALGVSVNDTFRVLEGLDAGDYAIKAMVSFDTVQLDRSMKATAGTLSYTIFRPNSGGGVQLPLIRISKVELLDTSGQPVGSNVPYANPVDIQSRAFENPGRGVKVDITDARLGILSKPQPPAGFTMAGLSLTFKFANYPPMTVTFSAPVAPAAGIASVINAAASLHFLANTVLAVVVDPGGENRVGIVPIDSYIEVSTGSGMNAFFGATDIHTTSDIRSSSVELAFGNWNVISPAIDQDNLDVAQVLDGNQIGFYGNLKFGYVVFPVDVSNKALLSVGSAFAPEIGRHLQVGARSIGSARCFFLEPTSIEFNLQSLFTATLADGAVVRFLPDPTLDTRRIPAAPSTVFPADGVVTALGDTLASSLAFVTDFAIIPGDKLYLHFEPIIGAVALASEVVNMKNKTLIISIDGGADQTVLYGNDSSSIAPTSVTKAGIANQINTQVGKVIASIDSGSNHLVLVGDFDIVVRSTGTANASLGLDTVSDSDNLYNDSSSTVYDIHSVDDGLLTVVVPAGSFGFPASATQLKFEVRRSSTQRCSSTQMNANTAESGLYYFDVELVSEGTGDIYNIDSAVQLHATGYRSDGYYLTTQDSDLTFSVLERPTLHVSRSILEVGVSDSPANATMLSGQNLEIEYDRSTLVSDAQNFVLSETERVVCSNPLSRHLIPHFVRFDYEYVGGSSSDVIIADMNKYILQRFPSDFLESSDLVGIAYKRGATSVTSPINLIAIVHNYDRTVQAQRSQNSLNTGRLAAFVPDVINVNRRSG